MGLSTNDERRRTIYAGREGLDWCWYGAVGVRALSNTGTD
jgi:hypothetical protein